MTATATAPPRTRRAVSLADGVVLAGVVCLLAFPVLARVAADRLPVSPPAALPPLPADAHRAPLPDLPAGLRPGPPPRRAEDLRPAAVALLGERTATRLLSFVSARTFEAPTGNGSPYRYAQLDRILPPTFSRAQIAAATDLGARLTLLPRLAAAPAAYAVLDRARATAACAPSLDVLLLVAADDPPHLGVIEAEARRALTACPGNPAPGWILGQVQSMLALRAGRDPRVGAAHALATFRRLERELPGSAAAWSGEGDARLRIAAVAAADTPQRAFVIRHQYARALAAYRRAAALEPGPEPDAGVGSALVGLGRPAEAAARLQRAAAERPRSPRLQQQFLLALERAHRFAAEARDARRVIGLPGAPEPGRAVYPAVPGPPGGHYADVVGLLSLGAGRLAPLSVHLFPVVATVAPSAAVIDTSFIPAFRDAPGVTDDAQGCPDLAYRRALVLAGSPASSLIRYPAEFSCEESGSLKAIALLELGERRGASADDMRQNLWRWAGDLPRAQRAASEWVAASHHAPEAVLRLGEIEFLRGRFDDAAADFGDAARRARERFATWTRFEAEATLDRGAALARAGRRAEAMTALRAADDIASRARGRGRGITIQVLPAAAISGHARLQLADAEREAGALRAAAEDYTGARYHGLPAATTGALENNAAIVDIALGHDAQAERATHQARAVDPESPAYLMTAAYAAARAGRIDTAIRRYGATLRADPTTYGAANDLGVLYARRGDTQRAVAALRRAVGADERYALGWFNLGVVLGGMGPRHLFASQGALARAFALDPALRDRERVPTLDARTYRTGLDVSRPLPAEWTFASSQRHAPAKTAGLAALLLVAFTLSRTLSATGSGRGLAEKWLSPLNRASGRFLGRLSHPAIAIAATLAVFALPLVRSPGGGVSAALAGVLGLVVLLALALRVRARAAGRQETWAPGVVFGLGTAAAGLTWAPLPVLKGDASARLHWAAPVALGSVALPLVLLAVWTDIPLTRSLAAAALVMAASLLTPVKPVDGGAIAEAGGTAAGLTAVGLAVVLALGLV